MRFAPVTAALSALFAVSASVSQAQEHEPDSRALALVSEGRALLESGDTQSAIDAFEAALAVDPAYTQVFLELGTAARSDGLQGKAIRYYREALTRDPGNLAAISGEGEALLEKGALEKAKRNLMQLRNMCGLKCPETQALESAIQRGSPALMAAETASSTAAQPQQEDQLQN